MVSKMLVINALQNRLALWRRPLACLTNEKRSQKGKSFFSRTRGRGRSPHDSRALLHCLGKKIINLVSYVPPFLFR